MTLSGRVMTPRAEDARAKNVETLVWMALLVGLPTFLELAKWIAHAGIFSLVPALDAVRAGVAVVTLDKHSLVFPITALLALIMLAALRLLDLGQSPRTTGAVIAICALGGGFVLDQSFAKPAITGFMAAHGYVRCQAGDYSVGRISFDAYVLSSKPCVARSMPA